MKTHSFPLNKFKFSGSVASSHFLSSLTGSGRLPTVCEDNSQASDLTTRPCLPHLTTKPRPSNPQTRSLFTGKVAGGRLPHLRCRIRMPGKKRKATGPHALQAQELSASHPKDRKAISKQTCTHPTQVRTPARRVTYVSSPRTVPNCRHTPAPVTHPKWTSAHPPPPPQGCKPHRSGRGAVSISFPRFFSCPVLSNHNYLNNQRIAPTRTGVSVSLLKPGWRPEHDKAQEPGSRQLSGG